MDALAKIASELKDPALILAFVVIVGLFYIIIKKDQYLCKVADNIEECNVTMASISAFMQILVAGRERRKGARD